MLLRGQGDGNGDHWTVAAAAITLVCDRALLERSTNLQKDGSVG